MSVTNIEFLSKNKKRLCVDLLHLPLKRIEINAINAIWLLALILFYGKINVESKCFNWNRDTHKNLKDVYAKTNLWLGYFA